MMDDQKAMPAEKPAPEGNATQLVADISSKLGQLSDLLNSAQGIAPEDKQAFQQIMAAYDAFVNQNLGGEPGQEQKPMPAKGGAPMEAGVRETQPAY